MFHFYKAAEFVAKCSRETPDYNHWWNP